MTSVTTYLQRYIYEAPSASPFQSVASTPRFLFQKISRLRRVYNNVNDIDLFVGMSLERPGFNGAFVGPTFLCLIGDQFVRLKKGDRFFYDLGGQAGSFTPRAATSRSRVLCEY